MKKHFLYYNYNILIISIFLFRSIFTVEAKNKIIDHFYVDKNDQLSFIIHTEKKKAMIPSHTKILESSIYISNIYASTMAWEAQKFETKLKYDRLLTTLNFVRFREDILSPASISSYFSVNLYDPLYKNFIGIGFGKVSELVASMLENYKKNKIFNMPMTISGGFTVIDKIFIQFDTGLLIFSPFLGNFTSSMVIFSPIDEFSIKFNNLFMSNMYKKIDNENFTKTSINSANILISDYKFKLNNNNNNIYILVSTGIGFWEKNKMNIQNITSSHIIFEIGIGYNFNQIRF